jgi:hypothetical protein
VFVPLVVTIVMRSRPKGLHIGPRFAGLVRCVALRLVYDDDCIVCALMQMSSRVHRGLRAS